MHELFRGDCLAVMPTLRPATVDAVVTDPPYGLSFMGKGWDHAVPGTEYWEAALRLMKPGAYLVAFGGSRTFHRMACAIEDAGFQIRDTIMWLYGSGFPKARSCLKPAHEPIILARRPGPMRPLGIDECRVAMNRGDADRIANMGGFGREGYRRPRTAETFMQGTPDATRAEAHTAGRWPANVAHDGSDEVLAAFAAFGERGGGGGGRDSRGRIHEAFSMDRPRKAARNDVHPGFGDTGTAARFFYCAKASKAERAGSDHPTVKPLALMSWLCRLVTPPGGVILDPFLGSGTTGAAAVADGFRFIGIERDPGYFRTAKRRIAAAERAQEQAAA
jgi:site-specific DNA-methyltransferase (adenine-specific)